jgi:hypothetical protein
MEFTIDLTVLFHDLTVLLHYASDFLAVCCLLALTYFMESSRKRHLRKFNKSNSKKW